MSDAVRPPPRQPARMPVPGLDSAESVTEATSCLSLKLYHGIRLGPGGPAPAGDDRR